MKRMDQSVDPCDDFYKFSCGGLDNKMNAIAEDRESSSILSTWEIAIENRIRGKKHLKISLLDIKDVYQ